ncbi:hypothetical protein IAG44_19400 [Streptomyces roseirectus]|uniref:Integral membrane protein n=1 Tax=Streptomyces roseirectus TaxID=2768066 RepID=A0A7H0IST8_9ACTN|nr:hypothetical protein IAG44_19400 [Streptomyces roseirectus]
MTRNTRTPRSTRTTLSAALVALACLLAPFATLTLWASYGLRDQERYVEALAPLATDAAVRRTIVEGVAREAPGVPRRVVEDEVRRFTATPAYRAAWDEGNRETYAAVMRALADPARDEVAVPPSMPARMSAPAPAPASKRQLGFTQASFSQSPVTLLPRQNLDVLRRSYHALDVAGFWLPVAAVAFAGAGIAVAVCRRRALTATALGTALGGALLGVAVVVARHFTVDGLTDPAHRTAAAAVYDALTETLRTASWLLLAGGLTVAGAAWLAGVVRARA